jgi:hypothetical protein
MNLKSEKNGEISGKPLNTRRIHTLHSNPVERPCPTASSRDRASAGWTEEESGDPGQTEGRHHPVAHAGPLQATSLRRERRIARRIPRLGGICNSAAHDCMPSGSQSRKRGAPW